MVEGQCIKREPFGRVASNNDNDVKPPRNNIALPDSEMNALPRHGLDQDPLIRQIELQSHERQHQRHKQALGSTNDDGLNDGGLGAGADVRHSTRSASGTYRLQAFMRVHSSGSSLDEDDDEDSETEIPLRDEDSHNYQLGEEDAVSRESRGSRESRLSGASANASVEDRSARTDPAPPDYRLRHRTSKDRLYRRGPRTRRQRSQIPGEAFSIQQQQQQQQLEDEIPQLPGAYRVPNVISAPSNNLEEESDEDDNFPSWIGDLQQEQRSTITNLQPDQQQEHVEEEAQQTSQKPRSGASKRRKPIIISIVTLVILTLAAIVAAIVVSRSNKDKGPGLPPKSRSSQIQALIEKVIPNSMTSAWDDPTSPQSKALTWLESDDLESLGIHVGDDDDDGAAASSLHRLGTRYALATFFFATGGSLGDNDEKEKSDQSTWIDKMGFLSPIHECDWTSADGRQGVTCDASGQVSSIIIDDNNLHGHLPEEIGMLSHLQQLRLHENDLAGSIPTTFGMLTRLTHWDVSENSLTSSIPSTMRHVTSLVTLRLGSNHLMGEYKLLLSQFTKLRELNISHNEFDDAMFDHAIQDCLHCASLWLDLLFELEVLDVSYCSFRGVLPLNKFDHLNSLRELYFDGNAFTELAYGTDSGFRHLRSLALISGTNNELRGLVQWSIFQASKLQWLDLSNNFLTGLYHSGCFYSHATLVECDVGPLLGADHIPSTLEYVNLANNTIKSSIPENIGEIHHLKDLILSNNLLTGTLPSSLGRMMVLQTLDVSQNHLEGSIPVALSNCSKLVNLTLHGNQFTGNIPNDFAVMTSLRHVTMHENQFRCDVDFPCFTSGRDGMVPVHISVDCSENATPVVNCSASCCACT